MRDINQLFVDLAQRWDGLDGFVHAIALPRENRWKGIFWIRSREASRWRTTSALQLPALARAARPMMRGRNGACLTLSYLGGARHPALQCDGPGQGQPGSQRALYRRQPGPRQYPRQRHFRRSDQNPWLPRAFPGLASC